MGAMKKVMKKAMKAGSTPKQAKAETKTETTSTEKTKKTETKKSENKSQQEEEDDALSGDVEQAEDVSMTSDEEEEDEQMCKSADEEEDPSDEEEEDSDGEELSNEGEEDSEEEEEEEEATSSLKLLTTSSSSSEERKKTNKTSSDQDDKAGAPPQNEEVPVPEVLAKTEEHEKDPYLLKDAAYIKSDPNWRNKQRTLLFSTRGISGQHRHLMEDLKKMMPHHKLESKFEKREDFSVVNEVAELKSCNNVLFFEARGKRQDLYLHVARVPHGPTVKFQVLNVHTSGEVRLSGNCLQFSRALLTFDAPFDTVPHLQLIKELFTQSLGAPRNHPKSKPFHDHALSFFYADKKIWVRHYQIAPLTDADGNDPEKQTLTEIGPRFVLDPIWILQGSFSGKKIFHNEAFMTPTAARREAKQSLGVQAKLRAEQTEQTKQMHQMLKRSADPTDAIFEDME